MHEKYNIILTVPSMHVCTTTVPDVAYWNKHGNCLVKKKKGRSNDVITAVKVLSKYFTY